MPQRGNWQMGGPRSGREGSTAGSDLPTDLQQALRRSGVRARSQRSKKVSEDGSRLLDGTVDENGSGQLPSLSCRHSPSSRYNASSSTLREPVEVFSCAKCSYVIIKNKLTVFVTTVLTVWVLICDDVRLLCSDKPADLYFNIILLSTIVVFSVEVILMSIGKPNYLMGFFFSLDVFSTATLVLDLPWVQDYMHEESSGGDINNTARGRTARIGSRSARVVRVVRLVRIVKLYRLAISAIESKLDKGKQVNPGEQDDWDEFADSPQTEGQRKESRVARKLSELTTKRVIILILSMLIAVPSMSVSDDATYPPSSFYGADEVWDRFTALVSATEHQEYLQLAYEESMLRFLYYHNWFTQIDGCPSGKASSACANLYYSQVFWVGIRGTDNATISSFAAKAAIRPATVAAWASKVAVQDDLYNFGQMTATARDMVSSPWDTSCSTHHFILRGVSLLVAKAIGSVRCPGDLRAVESEAFYPRLITMPQFGSYHMVFYFDLRPLNSARASMGFTITIFVCFVLCVATMLFTRDANNLVLYPLEDMIQKVEAIRDSPLKAVKMADSEFRAEERARIDNQARVTRIRKAIMCEKGHTQQLMETRVLEKTIIKLGSLLALGFGQAGVNIINQNMASSETAGVDVMIAGQRVECIIGHASISDFSVATEVLQSKVMAFVNQVAEIVHGIVNEFHGAANKNTGDTFLLVWVLSDPEDFARLADMSIIAFSKILGAVHQSHMLAEYRGHPSLQQRLGSHFRVCLNLGLHAGWAIEGAVGSEFKIDASYISPNVAIAESVEYATRQYGVSFMASEAVVALCRQECRQRCRVVDRVLIPGSTEPMELYVIDLHATDLKVASDLAKPMVWNPRQRFKVRQFLEAEKMQKQDSNYSAGRLFHTDQVLAAMRQRYTEDFLQVFKMGYKNYLEGEWPVARNFLSCTHTNWGFEDGPSAALLRFMDCADFQAPEDWPGFHELHCLSHAEALGTAKTCTTHAVCDLAREPPDVEEEQMPRASARSVPRRRQLKDPTSDVESTSGHECETLPDKAFMRTDTDIHRASSARHAHQALPVLPSKGDSGRPDWM